ncbi:hypothetical protein AVEN_69477-1 [Araneus ventricosus]|uniref:Uncharacterized protein n=1 Tax=Araneus ventricosus TaxID=182803 RepID=A0A4Y2KZK5_ARAVE|nr:hypothetical protein AVEN_69477-1 [Araneus ventricosus]
MTSYQVKPTDVVTSEKSGCQDHLMVYHNTPQTLLPILVHGCDDGKPTTQLNSLSILVHAHWISPVLDAVVSKDIPMILSRSPNRSTSRITTSAICSPMPFRATGTPSKCSKSFPVTRKIQNFDTLMGN